MHRKRADNKDKDSSSSGISSEEKVLLVSDPLGEEEAIMDGSITYSLNSDNELCALHKPGGAALTPSFYYWSNEDSLHSLCTAAQGYGNRSERPRC